MAKYLKKNMKSIIEDKVKAKLDGINKIPNQCDVCDKPFDKTDKEQVFSWMLRINKDNQKYDLFCPECYNSYFQKNQKETLDEQGK